MAWVAIKTHIMRGELTSHGFHDGLNKNLCRRRIIHPRNRNQV